MPKTPAWSPQVSPLALQLFHHHQAPSWITWTTRCTASAVWSQQLFSINEKCQRPARYMVDSPVFRCDSISTTDSILQIVSPPHTPFISNIFGFSLFWCHWSLDPQRGSYIFCERYDEELSDIILVCPSSGIGLDRIRIWWQMENWMWGKARTLWLGSWYLNSCIGCTTLKRYGFQIFFISWIVMRWGICHLGHRGLKTQCLKGWHHRVNQFSKWKSSFSAVQSKLTRSLQSYILISEMTLRFNKLHMTSFEIM